MELFKKQKHLDYFKKCHEISIWAFFELLQTNDLSLLLKPKSREIKESDKEELCKAYFNLFDEYVELSEDRHIIDMLQERGKLNQLKLEVTAIGLMLEHIIQGYEVETYVKILKANHRIKFDLSGDFKEEVEKVIQWVKVKQMDIDFIEKELNKKTDKKKQTIESQSVVLSNIYGFRIDTKNTTVTEWLAYVKQAKDIQDGKRN